GENFALTAAHRRQRLGQRVVGLDPEADLGIEAPTSRSRVWVQFVSRPRGRISANPEPGSENPTRR
ncbi:hypothetical protein, partial [Rubrivirga sp.]|uniref:hypothetical protein n=1 Tax=Rubrivirga sp. TaxID=1885344 RepID=UPI003C762B15